MYAIYDMNDSEICVGLYETGKDAAKAMGLNLNSFYSFVTRGDVSRKGYKVVKEEEL